jgi:electron transfer flavoprotein beta subunit
MKILVCVSITPDTTARIAFANNQFDANGVSMMMNPYDEWYALVRAVELKEAQGGNVTLFHVGSATNDQILRKGLAIGADEAVRVDAVAPDAFFVATQIAEYAKSNAFDLIFLGKETIDYNGSEVGGMVAELLDAPFVSYATSLQVANGVATITREIEGGKEVLESGFPLVLSAAKGMAEQRIPNMMGIMKAKSKPFKVIEPVSTEARLAVSQFTLPPARTAVKMVAPDNMDELVRLLHEEAKVI